jgi:hypothetical protein
LETCALEVLQVSPVLSVAKASLPDIVHEVGIATKLARTRIEMAWPSISQYQI